MPESLRISAALPPRHRDIQRQQNRRRRIDGHRCRNFGQVDAVEQPLHVFDGIDRHADLAHFARGERMIGIHANLRRQIERHRKPGRAIRQQIFVAFVRLLGIAHARILAHGPQPAAVHGGLHAARKGIFAGIANFAFVVGAFEIGRRVERINGNVRGSFNLGWFGRVFNFSVIGHLNTARPKCDISSPLLFFAPSKTNSAQTSQTPG